MRRDDGCGVGVIMRRDNGRGVGVIVWRDDGHGTVVKGNDGGGWSSNGVMLWLGRRQNGDAVE
jgi:hypothetical protein